jgi:hypothetical protein
VWARWVTLSLCLAFTGCYSGRGTEEAADSKTSLPLGIMTPSSDGSGATTGIFPGSIVNDPNCCWLGPSASFEVRVPAKARVLILTVFVPDLKPFHDRSQSLSIAVDRSPARRFEHLQIGTNVLPVPLRPSESAHVSDVIVNAGFSFTPKSENITDDLRQLSIYLKSVNAR